MKARHVGDTPVKQSLNIPAQITELTPREVLLQKFTLIQPKIEEVTSIFISQYL